MNRIHLIKCVFLTSGLAAVMGCEPKPKDTTAIAMATQKASTAPADVAFMVDGTASAGENRKKGLAQLSFLLKPGTLAKGSKINLFRMDCLPKSIWSGKVTSGNNKEIVDAFNEALDGSHQCGTDGCKAFAKALDWLISEGQKDPSARLILTGYHDGIADECRSGKGEAHPAREATFLWSGAKAAGVEVVLFGISEDIAPQLRAAWAPRLTSLSLYTPSHQITKEDLGFAPGSLF